MHEASLVHSIMRQVEIVCAENQISKVSKVVVELGEVSFIIPDYLTDYWNWSAKKVPLFEDSLLQFETIPAITLCNSCGENYPTVQYGKTCPHCRSEDTVLIQGDEFIIREIEA
jgi:hydrogenase nickel incorporation protein HypA/HybF